MAIIEQDVTITVTYDDEAKANVTAEVEDGEGGLHHLVSARIGDGDPFQLWLGSPGELRRLRRELVAAAIAAGEE